MVLVVSLLLSCLRLYLLALVSLLLSPLVSDAGPGPLPKLPWAASGPLLGPLGGPGRLPAAFLAALGPLLARPWAAPGLSWAVLAASWASFGGSWAALGRDKPISTKPCNKQCFCMVLGPPGAALASPGPLLGAPGSLLRPSWRSLGASWVLLGRSCGLLGPSWAALAPPRCRSWLRGSCP